MAFNISEFQSQISATKFGGITTSNKHAVRITPPQKIMAGIGDSFPTALELSFFCSTTNLPGKNINTFDHKPYSYGQTVKIPISRTNDSLTLSFLCDSNYVVMSFFHRWLNYIVQDGGMVIDNRGYREIGYKEDYATTVELIGYDSLSNERITYTLYEAFPVQIGAVQTGWEMNDTILQIPIEFTYDDMSVKVEQINPSDTNITRSPVGLFTRIAQIASIAGVINSVKRPRNLQDLINTGTTIRTLGRGLGIF